jgi:hypothetical protein
MALFSSPAAGHGGLMALFSSPAAGQQQQFRALALGQRPFLDSPFTNHLRELESYHHHHHHRRKSETSPGGGFKVPVAATTPIQGKTDNLKILPALLYIKTSLFPRRYPDIYLSQSYSHMCTKFG